MVFFSFEDFHVITYQIQFILIDNCFVGYFNGFTSYFIGFSLYISNTTNRLDGDRCFHDKTYTKHTIPDHVSINCPYVGQYVFYYNERFPGMTYPEGYSKYAYGDLCEVEVYGYYFSLFLLFLQNRLIYYFELFR